MQKRLFLSHLLVWLLGSVLPAQVYYHREAGKTTVYDPSIIRPNTTITPGAITTDNTNGVIAADPYRDRLNYIFANLDKT